MARNSRRTSGSLDLRPKAKSKNSPIKSIPARFLMIAGIIVALLIVLAASWLILSQTSLFSIHSIEADPTDHITSDDISRLADVAEGTTLLNVDTASISEKIHKNPWVERVTVNRVFPDKLRISITERKIQAIVLLSGDSVAWYMSSDGVWIEPAVLQVPEGKSLREIAQQHAHDLGCFLVTNVPAGVEAVAGTSVNFDSLSGIRAYMDGFSGDLAAQIQSFSAASSDALECQLSSGVTISLGSASDIPEKENIIQSILAAHPGQITYINVRIPSKPSYRSVGTDKVQAQGSQPASS